MGGGRHGREQVFITSSVSDIRGTKSVGVGSLIF